MNESVDVWMCVCACVTKKKTDAKYRESKQNVEKCAAIEGKQKAIINSCLKLARPFPPTQHPASLTPHHITTSQPSLLVSNTCDCGMQFIHLTLGELLFTIENILANLEVSH